MDKFLELLADSLNSGNQLLGFLVVVVAFLFNFKHFYSFFNYRKRIKINALKEALKSDFVKGVTKDFLKEELVVEYFKVIAGVRLEKIQREELIKAHARTNGEVSFLSFKRALPYIGCKEGRLSVKISTFDNVYYYFHFLGGIFLAVFGMFLIFLPIIISSYDLLSLLFHFLTGAFFVFAAGFMVYQSSSVSSAKLVKSYLLRSNHKKSMQQTTDASAD